MNRRLALCAGLLAVMGSAFADTGVKVVTASIPLTDTNWSLPLSVPQFNVPGGTLTSVEIAFTGGIVSAFGIENRDPIVNSYSVSSSYQLGLTSPSGVLVLSVVPVIPVQTGQLQAADGTLDFAGTGGITVSNLNATASGTTTLTSAADLAAFLGSGNASLPVAANSNATIKTSANATSYITTQASASATVTYHYTYQAPTGSIGDRVFFDANGNGIQDAGEKGIAGDTVTLYNSSGVAIATTTTDTQGNYLFSGLSAGNYTVGFGLPTGYAFTVRDAGTDDTKDSDADGSGKTGVITLAAGQDRLDVDAGLVGTLCLGDRVFFDCNKDGFNEPNEPGVPNVPVHLIDASGVNIANATTDCNGYYKFSNLAPGSYSVKFDAPTGFGFTQQFAKYNGQLLPVVDSNVDPSNGLATVSLSSTDLTIDAGLVPALKVCGTVWGDSNGNGICEPGTGEKGLPGIHVWLGTNLDCFGIPHTLAWTVTDKDGHYEFDGLGQGYCSVGVYTCDLPSGMTPVCGPLGFSTQNWSYLCLNSDCCTGNFGYKPINFGCVGASHTWWCGNLNWWPTDCVTIGGQCHPKSVACAWLKQTNCNDMSVCMYQRICAAKLNVGCGFNHGTVLSCGSTTCCVADAITKCDAWMVKHPVGCNVSANCADWASVSDCFGILKKFCGY